MGNPLVESEPGFVSVPIEPTEEMLKAGNEWTEAGEIWGAMLEKAPKVPVMDRGAGPLPGITPTGINVLTHR